MTMIQNSFICCLLLSLRQRFSALWEESSTRQVCLNMQLILPNRALRHLIDRLIANLPRIVGINSDDNIIFHFPGQRQETFRRVLSALHRTQQIIFHGNPVLFTVTAESCHLPPPDSLIPCKID